MFNREEDKSIKEIFKYFKGWTFKSSCSDGIVYWEVNFKEEPYHKILEILKNKIYELPFEPAVSIGKNNVSTFYGLYNVETLRKKLKLSDFSL